MLFVILISTNGVRLNAQCSPSADCLINPPLANYECVVGVPVNLSTLVAPSGPLPAGGGYVNLVVQGALTVDIDYVFSQGSHILLMPGSQILFTGGSKLTVLESFITSCEGKWFSINVSGAGNELVIENSFVLDGNIGVRVVNNGSIKSTGTLYADSNRGIELGDCGGSLNQSLGVTLVDNEFISIRRPITLCGTAPISIGTGNSFLANGVVPIGDTDLSAIAVTNSSVSIAPGNVITGFNSGVFHINQTSNHYFLNIDGATFKGNFRGVRAHDFTSGISASVINSTFESNRAGSLVIRVQNGGNCYIKDNYFNKNGENSSGSNGTSILGDFPNRVFFLDNKMENTLVGGGVSVSFPFWNAGNNMRIEGNYLDVKRTGVFLSLKGGGIINDNTIQSTPSGFAGTGIHLRNSPGATISYNNIKASGGDGTVSGSILIENSPASSIFCNTTDGLGSSGGLVFLENCDGSVVQRNSMTDHQRGLALYSVNGDGVIGVQPYRDNLWYGATVAEAAAGGFLGPAMPSAILGSQFKVQQNTGAIWPSPIIPSQPVSGTSSDWFWYDPAPIRPTLCPVSENPPTKKDLTRFEEALIDGDISAMPGSEGRYRDHDFRIYYKLKENPTLLTPSNQGYYDGLNTASFQKRYQVEKGFELMSALASEWSISESEDAAALQEQLAYLTVVDDGANAELRDSMLAEVNTAAALLNGTRAAYRAVLDSEASTVTGFLQNWVGEEAADSLLQDVLSIYMNNFGVGIDGYTQTEQEAIADYASRCVLTFGEGVYLANAIAGTLEEYDLFDACTPMPQALMVPNPVHSEADALKLFPSPTTGIVNIQAQEEISNMRVFNTFGQALKQWENAPSGHHELNLGGMAPGIYLIEINYTNGERQIGKVVLHR